MGHARRHFAHGDQAARGLRAFSLARGLLFGIAARRDVAGNHHLRQAPVDPGEVARAHLQPAVEFFHEHLGIFGAGVGQRVGGHAGEGIDCVAVVRAGRGLGARQIDQVPVALASCAEPQAVHLVGEQHFVAAQRRHRHGRVQAFQHGGEALIGRREFLANALGLGDVGHRGHPAGLVALGIDQR
ncbi:hypothetical protein FQZ97_919600 [compost metagenome]